MTLFFLLAAALVIAALAMLLPGIFSDRSAAVDVQRAANIDIAKERKQALTNALNSGEIDQATFDLEIQDLEAGLAADLDRAEKRASNRSAILPAAIVAAFVPISAGALYLHLGTPQAINGTEAMPAPAATSANNQNTAAPDQPATQAPALDSLIPQLEQRLADNPEDLEGWKLLGRTYLTLSDFDGAVTALERALALNDTDPDVLAPLAEATAMSAGGSLLGRPTELLGQSLDANPEHEQSIWLMGIANQQAGEHEAAIVLFEALRTRVPDNPEAQATIDELVQRSRTAMGESAPPSDVAPASNTATNSAGQTSPAAPQTSAGTEDSSASVTVSVSLGDAAAGQVSPDQAVFVYARASNGPPMPLAVQRLLVRDLPITVTLDESMAMLPAMTLANFPSVTVGARVSASGNAIAQSGDWFEEQLDVAVTQGEPLTLIINRQKP